MLSPGYRAKEKVTWHAFEAGKKVIGHVPSHPDNQTRVDACQVASFRGVLEKKWGLKMVPTR